MLRGMKLIMNNKLLVKQIITNHQSTCEVTEFHQHNTICQTNNYDQELPDFGVVTETQLPKMYKVLLLNDDFTPMDFVVYVLKRYFGKSNEEAEKIMLNVHHQGQGIAGVFSKEVAEMKIYQVEQLATQSKYPLKSTLEEE